MTSEEAKQAFIKQCPVIDRSYSARSDVHYKCISALIYRIINGKPAGGEDPPFRKKYLYR